MFYTEFGSDFHFAELKEDADSSLQNTYPQVKLFFSGRSALFHLIRYGMENYGWEKLYLPDYYCHEVSTFIKQLPINISFYNDGPYGNGDCNFNAIDQQNNVIVQVNYFGVTSSSYSPKKAILIEDHTHDLISEWALNSNAHFCFASLRKSLPVPAGGAVWSPRKLTLPEETPESQNGQIATAMKMNAMLMKTIYLEGNNIRKDDFRKLFTESEQLFSKKEATGKLGSFTSALLRRIPLDELRRRKMDNYGELRRLITRKEILWPRQVKLHDCPFGFIMQLGSTETRDHLKKYLISRNIYPAVLWPNQDKQRARDFADKSLLIHCDFRYTKNDMLFIGNVINDFFNEN